MKTQTLKLKSPTGSKTITLEDKEILNIYIEDFEAGTREFELIVKLQGLNAQCFIEGRVQSTKKDKKIWKISQVFQNIDQKGSINLRGTAEDSAFLQLDGSGILKTQSKNADIHIHERIILFDEGKGKLLPVLTVQTNQVTSASHSASVAPVEEDQILYLQSRGYTSKKAKEIIKSGFLRQR